MHDRSNRCGTNQRADFISHALDLTIVGSPVMATGSRLNNTLCITRNNQAWLSRRLGDLDSAAAWADHESAATQMMIWQAAIPAIIARDIDPASYSVRFAIDLATQLGIPHLSVQHHHAHVAAVCAEHGVCGTVIGLVLDDAGMGIDGASWGGELLKVADEKFDRLGHLSPIRQPGGELTVREPWRLATAVLHQLMRPEEVIRRYDLHPASIEVSLMLSERRNCPPTSSAASLFAAVSSLLRLTAEDSDDCARSSPSLERAAQRYLTGDYVRVNDSLWQIDAANCLDLYPLLELLIDEPDSERGAATFYANLIAGATEWAASACDYYRIDRIVLAGSCMQSAMLRNGLRDGLVQRGIKVYEPHQLSCDDSAIALGQAWVALHTLKTANSPV